MAYGIFSKTAAEKFGSSIYKTATGTVEVTTVVSNPDTFAETYKFPDAVVVGEVAGFVRKGRDGTVRFLDTRIDLELPPRFTRRHW